MKTVAVIGAFDSKGAEYSYLIDRLHGHGVGTLSIDLSALDEPTFLPDIAAKEVAAAGGRDFLSESDCDLTKSEKMSIMARGAVKIVSELQREARIHGIIAMGGGQGTFMATEVMRVLPIGFPKLLVSTILNLPGTTHRAFRDLADTLLMNSVVDVSGDNAIILSVIDEAAGAIAGMLAADPDRHLKNGNAKKKIAISMWGVTTPCVNRIRRRLEDLGYEVYAFHANGVAGGTIERLVKQGFFQGVVEITLSEFVQDRIGVYNRPLPNRLDGPSEADIPYVLVPGGVDMVQMVRPFDVLPEKYRNRQSFFHNENAMFVRSTSEECALIGREIAKKLNAARYPAKVFLPAGGLSDADKPGGPLWNPESDRALFSSLRENLKNTDVTEVNAHINDIAFADLVAEAMDSSMKARYTANQIDAKRR